MISKDFKNSTIDFAEGEMILIDKDSGMSSFDVIRRIKKIVRIMKIGHAGTLDPLATGLMILCTGKMTKKIDDYQGMDKTYEGSFHLGATTPSFDLETDVNEHFQIDHITDDLLELTTNKFKGEIEQIPPVYSAIRIQGERLYKKARRGEHVEIKSRKVKIHEFSLVKNELPRIQFVVKCSKGTYIRSLAYDFGKALNSGAYLSSLRRTEIGSYSVNHALSLDEFAHLVNNTEISAL